MKKKYLNIANLNTIHLPECQQTFAERTSTGAAKI